MVYFAKIENDVVKDCIVLHESERQNSPEIIKDKFGLLGEWLLTDEIIGVNCVWLPAEQKFVEPKPFPSWVLDANYSWVAPIPAPQDGAEYFWDEANTDWKLK